MIEKMASVVTVHDLEDAVSRWTVLTGISPSFVDAGRWAQFDTPGGRIALSCVAESPHGSGVMFKVRDLAVVRGQLLAAGFATGELETGSHEQRFVLVVDGAVVTYYTPC